MSTATLPESVISAAPIGGPEMTFYRLSVAQYLDMVKAGILAKGDRVELLEGHLVAKMTKYPKHVLGTKLVVKSLSSLLPAGWHLAQESPLTTVESVPEPDVAVIRGMERDYAERHPSPGDIGLIVEVADTSVRKDQVLMKDIYARAAIGVYWIVNIPEARVEVYEDPTGPSDAPDYRRRRDFGPEDAIPVVLDGREAGRIAVREILP